MMVLSRSPLSYTIPAVFTTPVLSMYPWRVVIYHKSGGIKREWYLGAEGCPIQKINFELNLKLMGAGTIKMAFLDFPVDANDEVNIYYNGTKVYRAIVDNTIDPKGGDIRLIPFHQRFAEVLVSNVFAAKTISEIFETIVTATQADTTIGWNDFQVDTGDTATYSPSFAAYETAKKVFDEYIDKLDSRYWGVTVGNIFSVYELSSYLSRQLFYGDDPAYTEIEVVRDYEKITDTRYQVFKKTSGAGEVTRIGQVGYDITYPSLSIENITRKKEGKFIVSEVIASDSEALNIAYQTLISKTAIPLSVKIKNLDVSKYFPTIGDLITVEDRTEKSLVILNNCETLSDWSASSGTISIETTLYAEGAGSLKWVVTTSDAYLTLDLGKIYSFLEIEKIVFMIYGQTAGSYLSFDVSENANMTNSGVCSIGVNSASSVNSDYLFEDSVNIEINTSSVWQLVSMPPPSISFQYLRFKTTAVPPGNIYIDRVQVYSFNKQLVTANVVKASITIDEKGTNCEVELSEYNRLANDDIFAIERKIEKLEAIQKA